ncbi:MAG: GntR family transcriptional regulator [Synergistaceae bacterium]|nr:GntR family transcriptional regulator [Synergistaceae bacterium]
MSKDSLCEQAYNYILELITDFELKPNDPIIENDIGQKLNISRTPLREALRRLEADGLVYKVRNRGTYVRSFSYEDVTESCEIRKLFELYSLKQCIEKASDEELKELHEKLIALSSDSSAESFYESDIILHKTIMKYCMNSKMVAFLNTINTQLETFRRISGRMPNRLLKSKQEHLDILNAIEKRDIALATEKLSLHLDNVKESTWQAFKEFKMNYMD